MYNTARALFSLCTAREAKCEPVNYHQGCSSAFARGSDIGRTSGVPELLKYFARCVMPTIRYACPAPAYITQHALFHFRNRFTLLIFLAEFKRHFWNFYGLLQWVTGLPSGYDEFWSRESKIIFLKRDFITKILGSSWWYFFDTKWTQWKLHEHHIGTYYV